MPSTEEPARTLLPTSALPQILGVILNATGSGEVAAFRWQDERLEVRALTMADALTIAGAFIDEPGDPGLDLDGNLVWTGPLKADRHWAQVVVGWKPPRSATNAELRRRVDGPRGVGR